MKTRELKATRRSILSAGAATALLLLLHRSTKLVSAQQEGAIAAKEVPKIPEAPDDGLWQQARATGVPLNPQNIVVPRVTEASVKSLSVRALYDTRHVGFLLEWRDSRRDLDLGTVTSFRDAAALMFPARRGELLPSFTMGHPGAPVTIYHWKADWQYARLHDVDEAYPHMVSDHYPFSGKGPGEIAEAVDYAQKGDKAFVTAWWAGNALADPGLQARSSVEKLRAEGFGTLETQKEQDGSANGVWKDGVWRVVVTVLRSQPERSLEPGKVIPVAFAVWDGSLNERNGQKAFSFWQSLTLEAPARMGVLVPLLSGIGGVVVIVLAALVGLRLWRRRRLAGR